MKILSLLTVLLAICLSSSGAMAEVRSAIVAYKDGDENLTGYLYWNDAVEGKRPGVLVVHEWWGLDDYARSRAQQLAELGYVAFAVDMYGGDKVTSHPAQAKEWMMATVSNLDAWRSRAQKGLDKLASLAITDNSRLAAIGYCFGGATVMQLAYAGADLRPWSVSTDPCPCRATVKRKTTRAGFWSSTVMPMPLSRPSASTHSRRR